MREPPADVPIDGCPLQDIISLSASRLFFVGEKGGFPRPAVIIEIGLRLVSVADSEF